MCWYWNRDDIQSFMQSSAINIGVTKILGYSNNSILFVNSDGFIYQDSHFTFDYSTGIFKHVDGSSNILIKSDEVNGLIQIGTTLGGIYTNINTDTIKINGFVTLNSKYLQSTKTLNLTFSGNSTDSIFISGNIATGYLYCIAQSSNDSAEVKYSTISSNTVKIVCTKPPLLGTNTLHFTVTLSNL